MFITIADLVNPVKLLRYAPGVIDESAIRTRYGALAPALDERARRLILGAERNYALLPRLMLPQE
ncbi:MAG: hypothetical protein WKF56_00480 [Candidatus Limnocylindrales bacterium]